MPCRTWSGRDRIAERWRSGRGIRWWPMALPGTTASPASSSRISIPMAFRVRIVSLRIWRRMPGNARLPSEPAWMFASFAAMRAGRDFAITTSDGLFEANRVVVATGAFQRPEIPPIAPKDEGLTQIHSADYRNPSKLPEGAVLVVGAGSSGVQIAEELNESGREVFLSVGPHDRPPRAYRNRDYCWWLGVFGEWDAATPAPGREHVTIAVSGARGGHTIDFRRLALEGVTLVGRAESFRDGRATFHPDLAENIARGDKNYHAVLDRADAYVERNGLDFPLEPEARRVYPEPACIAHPILQLDLAKAKNLIDHLGNRICGRLQLGAGRRVRREWQATASARRRERARSLLPGIAVPVASGVELYLGRLARRKIPGRSNRYSTAVFGLS